MFKDPVCKMMVNERTAENVSEIGGKKVYLCSAMCKEQFERNPPSMATDSSSKEDSKWQVFMNNEENWNLENLQS
jgi:YHS domain-containing protein